MFFLILVLFLPFGGFFLVFVFVIVVVFVLVIVMMEARHMMF